MLFSGKVSGSPAKNLTPAHRMCDDGVLNVMFSLESSLWSSVYLSLLHRWSLFI